ncbi:hypothetical protein LZC36_09870, partial [Campylobacter jejuni]
DLSNRGNASHALAKGAGPAARPGWKRRQAIFLRLGAAQRPVTGYTLSAAGSGPDFVEYPYVVHMWCFRV